MQRSVDRHKMVELMSRGWTQSQISKEFKVAESQIQYDWKQLRLEMSEHRNKDYEQAVAVREHQYLEVVRVAWEEFEASKAVVESLLDDGPTPPPPGGDMNCLRVVLTALAQLDDLEGIQTPKRKVLDADMATAEDAENMLEMMLPVVKKALEMVASKKSQSQVAANTLTEAARLGLTLPVVPLSNTPDPNTSQSQPTITQPEDDFDLEAWLKEREAKQ